MKKSIAQLLSAATLCLCALPAVAETVLIEKIAAVVDRSVVLQSEVEDRLAQVVTQARANSHALPELDTLRRQVLDHLIGEELQLQMARRVGLRVSEEHVNQAIEQIRRNNNLTQEQLLRQLQQDGLTLSKLGERLYRDITLQQIQQAMVHQRIHISPLEIDNFLNSADAQFWISPEYHLGHILVSLPQSAAAEEAEAALNHARSLVQRIRGGEPFASVAIAESRGQTALSGGDLGWRKTSDLPSLFAEIVPKLNIGEVSDPARSPAGFHILTLYDRRGGDQQTEMQARVRHILIKPSAILSDEEAQAKLYRIRQALLNGADFAELAKENSEDIGSMLAGGDLGWSRPGMFVPQFEQRVNTIAQGDISEPFRSQFGWHILQVTERRQEDITEELRREKAAQILTSRRFEDELQLWLREMRDDAFVETRL